MQEITYYVYDSGVASTIIVKYGFVSYNSRRLLSYPGGRVFIIETGSFISYSALACLFVVHLFVRSFVLSLAIVNC